jgi:histone deacetylase 11
VEALERGLVINLSGGYHHAKPDQGEGFCLFSDIALAIDAIRTSAPGREGGRIAYIDLDAHQGNGVCHHFLDDREVFVFDMYNATIYPWFDVRARERIDCDVPLPRGCDGSTYLGKLKERLPAFLDSVTSSRPVLLAVFNAGSDILAGDPLGGLGVSADEILERDRFVIAECGNRQIPVLMLPSGGYTRQSYQVIARTVLSLLPSCESGSGAIR